MDQMYRNAPVGLTDALLADLEAKASGATPGPYRACNCGICGLVWSNTVDVPIIKALEETDEESGVDRAERNRNALYAAAAHPGVVGALVAEVKRLREVHASSPITTAYTRAQLAAAVDEAHAALHEWESQAGPGHPLAGAIGRAHEALHGAGAGMPRVACATPDPEAQRLYAELSLMWETPLPCGHKVEDLIGGTDPATMRPLVTKCGACLAERQAAKVSAPLGPNDGKTMMVPANVFFSPGGVEPEEWKDRQ